MAQVVTKNLILRKARNIKTSPSVGTIKNYTFKSKTQVNKFVSWTGSANEALTRVKLPKKSDIQGLATSVSGMTDALTNFIAALLTHPEGPTGAAQELLEGGVNIVKNNPALATTGLLGLGLGGGIAARKFFKARSVKPKIKVKPKLTAPNKIKIKPKKISAQSLARQKKNPFPHIATGEKPPKSKVAFNKKVAKILKKEGSEKVAQQTTKKLTTKVAAKVGKKASKFVPGFGSLLSIGFAAQEFAEGDVTGGVLSLAGAIPVLGWAAIGVDIARDMGAFEGTPLGLNESEKKKQEKEATENVEGDVKKEEVVAKKPKITIPDSIVKFGLAVDDFEKIMSSDTMVVNSKTQVKSRNNLTDMTLGAMDMVTHGWFDFDKKGNNVVQETIQNPFKRFWNWFVPPPEKSNEPSVAAGIRTPETGFKHVVSMSNSNQILDSGNNIIVVQQQQPSIQPQQNSGMIPVPMSSGGGGGVSIVTPPESTIVNSLWTNILMTKLAQ